MKLISFVIPTYNFAKFIPQTLDSILQEDSSFYEIIIYDGFSTDDTESVVAQYLDKYNFIKYIRSSQRNNIDIDLNDAILEATGKYIWTLSADDLLIKGWLSYFLNVLKDNESDIYLFPAVHCDINMNKLYGYPILKVKQRKSQNVTLDNNNDFLSYLEMVRTSEGLFSFCSACVVDRVKIHNTNLLSEANGTCWRYASRIILMSTFYPIKIFVAKDFIILKRGDNDSFGNNGIIQRLKIAIIEWTNAIGSLKLDPILEGAILKKVHSDIGFIKLFCIKQMYVKTLDDLNLYKRIIKTKYPIKSIFVWILLNVPISKTLRFLLLILYKAHFGVIYRRYRVYF